MKIKIKKEELKAFGYATFEEALYNAIQVFRGANHKECEIIIIHPHLFHDLLDMVAKDSNVRSRSSIRLIVNKSGETVHEECFLFSVRAYRSYDMDLYSIKLI